MFEDDVLILLNKYDIKFVNTPCFVTYEIINNELVQKPRLVSSYTIHNLKVFEKILSSRGISEIFVFRDFDKNILNKKMRIADEKMFYTIRMCLISANKRYKLKTKKCQKKKLLTEN